MLDPERPFEDDTSYRLVFSFAFLCSLPFSVPEILIVPSFPYTGRPLLFLSVSVHSTQWSMKIDILSHHSRIQSDENKKAST